MGPAKYIPSSRDANDGVIVWQFLLNIRWQYNINGYISQRRVNLEHIYGLY